MLKNIKKSESIKINDKTESSFKILADFFNKLFVTVA